MKPRKDQGQIHNVFAQISIKGVRAEYSNYGSWSLSWVLLIFCKIRQCISKESI